MLLNRQLLIFSLKKLNYKKFNFNIRTIYQGKNFDPNYNKNKINSNYKGKNFDPNYNQNKFKFDSNYKGKNFNPNYNKNKIINSNYKGKNFDPNYYINKLNTSSNYKYKFNYNNDKFYFNNLFIKKEFLISMNYDLIYKKNIFFNLFNNNLHNIDKFNLFFNKIINFTNKNNNFYNKINYNIKYLNISKLFKINNNVYFNLKKKSKGLNYNSEIFKAIVSINSINVLKKKKIIKNYKIKLYNYKQKKKEYIYNKFINIKLFNNYLNNNLKKINLKKNLYLSKKKINITYFYIKKKVNNNKLITNINKYITNTDNTNLFILKKKLFNNFQFSNFYSLILFQIFKKHNYNFIYNQNILNKNSFLIQEYYLSYINLFKYKFIKYWYNKNFINYDEYNIIKLLFLDFNYKYSYYHNYKLQSKNKLILSKINLLINFKNVYNLISISLFTKSLKNINLKKKSFNNILFILLNKSYNLLSLKYISKKYLKLKNNNYNNYLKIYKFNNFINNNKINKKSFFKTNLKLNKYFQIFFIKSEFYRKNELPYWFFNKNKNLKKLYIQSNYTSNLNLFLYYNNKSKEFLETAIPLIIQNYRIQQKYNLFFYKKLKNKKIQKKINKYFILKNNYSEIKLFYLWRWYFLFLTHINTNTNLIKNNNYLQKNIIKKNDKLFFSFNNFIFKSENNLYLNLFNKNNNSLNLNIFLNIKYLKYFKYLIFKNKKQFKFFLEKKLISYYDFTKQNQTTFFTKQFHWNLYRNETLKKIFNNKKYKATLNNLNILNIFITFNNIFVTLCNMNGSVIYKACAGTLGIKGSKRSTPVACENVVSHVLNIAKHKNIHYFYVKLNGVLYTRNMKSAIKLLQSKVNDNLIIVRFINITPKAHNGIRLKKRKKV